MKTLKTAMLLSWVMLALGFGATLAVCYAQSPERAGVPPLSGAVTPGMATALAAPVRGGAGADAICYAMALVMGVACLGAAYAVGHVGTAGLGVISEKPERLGSVLLLVGLAEGIAIYGFIIAIMLYQKL